MFEFSKQMMKGLVSVIDAYCAWLTDTVGLRNAFLITCLKYFLIGILLGVLI